MGSGWREVPEPSSGATGSPAWLMKHHVRLYSVTLVPLRALPLLPTSLRVTEAPAAPTEVLVNLPAARGPEVAECGALLVARSLMPSPAPPRAAASAGRPPLACFSCF